MFWVYTLTKDFISYSFSWYEFIFLSLKCTVSTEPQEAVQRKTYACYLLG